MTTRIERWMNHHPMAAGLTMLVLGLVLGESIATAAQRGTFAGLPVSLLELTAITAAAVTFVFVLARAVRRSRSARDRLRRRLRESSAQLKAEAEARERAKPARLFGRTERVLILTDEEAKRFADAARGMGVTDGGG